MFRPFKEDWKNFLQQLKNEWTERSTPAAYAACGPIRGKFNDTTANGLTSCIVEYLRYVGGNFTRVNVTGIPRKDLKTGQIKWAASTTKKGTADILGVYKGRYMAIEVKIGPDRQSDDQKKEQRDVENAGGVYIIARNFPDFLKDFNAYKEQKNIV